MKVSELTGAQLDYWVAKAEGLEPYREESHKRYWLVNLPSEPCVIIGQIPKPPEPDMRYSPSVNWAQGGPIIERERITIGYWAAEDGWAARVGGGFPEITDHVDAFGITPLIAAMRAYVASKFGKELE